MPFKHKTIAIRSLSLLIKLQILFYRNLGLWNKFLLSWCIICIWLSDCQSKAKIISLNFNNEHDINVFWSFKKRCIRHHVCNLYRQLFLWTFCYKPAADWIRCLTSEEQSCTLLLAIFYLVFILAITDTPQGVQLLSGLF